MSGHGSSIHRFGRGSFLAFLLLSFAATALAQSAGPDGEVGLTYHARFVALAGTAPYTWAITQGALPPGLTLNASAGEITGTPTTSGTFFFSSQWTDVQGVIGFEVAYSITIYGALSIVTPGKLPSATQNVRYSETIVVTGGKTPYVASVSSGLPPGLSFDGTTRLLTGNPQAAGTFEFSITVVDELGASRSQTYILAVSPPLQIPSSSLPDGFVGSTYFSSLPIEGGHSPYTWIVLQGPLPPGLHLTSNGNFAGTPSEAGAYVFQVRVFDSRGNTVDSQFTVDILPRTITIQTTYRLPNGQVDVPYSLALQASGGTAPYIWALSDGLLPPPLVLLPGGVIEGTPQSPGQFEFEVTVTDQRATSARRILSVFVEPATLRIETSSPLPTGTLGVAYSVSISVVGGLPPYTWKLAEGMAPVGLSLTHDGQVVGTPVDIGSTSFVAEVMDSLGASAQQAFTLQVDLPETPEVTITGLPSQGQASQQYPMGIALSTGYPSMLRGVATLSFQPNAVANADDPAVRFLSGGRSAEFSVPSGETQLELPANQYGIQSGSVAGTIRVSVQLFRGETEITPTPAPVHEIVMQRTAPSITAVSVTRNSTGFTVAVTGVSTSREMASASFRFTPSPGANLQSTTATAQLGSVFATWYQSDNSGQFGSAFRYTQPFTIQGEQSAVSAVAVALTNAQGASQEVSTNLP